MCGNADWHKEATCCHKFEKFDFEIIFCVNCGETRKITKWYADWTYRPYPYIMPSTPFHYTYTNNSSAPKFTNINISSDA